MASSRVNPGKNVLKTWCIQNSKTFLLAEWDTEKNDGLSYSTITYASNKKVWWKCPLDHHYEARISNRVINGNGCPYCAGNKTLEGFNDFKTWCVKNGQTTLLDEWDYSKNTINPSQISPKNNKAVWWKCSLGHSWESSIGSRTSKRRPSGCPYCSQPPKRILVGFNDFDSWCHSNSKEYLLQEWNSEKNKITPQETTYGSGQRVWWKCKRGHEWYVSIANRAQGTGCPICSRTQTSFPEQALAFYLSKSLNLKQRYRIRGYEIDLYLYDYAIGIEYDGLFFHKEKQKIRDSEKDSFFSQLGIKLIRIKENTDKTGFDNNILYFIPQKSNYLDESFNAMICLLISFLESMTGQHLYRDVNIIRDQLEIRAHYSSVIKNNSFSAIFPELVPEWDVEKNQGMTPDSFSAFSQVKVWWKCTKGHSWKALISSRSRLGCPYCSGQRTIAGENDLESWCRNNNPSLLTEWDYDKNKTKPSEVSKTSNKKAWWKCVNGHCWEAVIANRVHGTRCPFCYTGNNAENHKVSLAEWCKEKSQNQLLAEWNYEKNGSCTPQSISKASHKKVWWKCSNGHEWEAEIKSRTYNHGCPYCSKTYKKVQIGINDLVTWCKENDRQYILDEWDYDSNENLLPEMFTFGSHQRINWCCSKGHTWNAVIKDRTKKRGNMCPLCKKIAYMSE